MSDMSEYVRIEKPLLGNDLDGVPDSWEFVCNQWANIRPLSGREYQQAQQMQSSTTHTIKTHLVANADSAMRLVAKDETIYNVESVVKQDGRNRFMIWRCVEDT